MRPAPALQMFLFVLILSSCVLAGAVVGQDGAAAQDTPKESPLEYVVLKTTRGEIVLELNREKAPVTVANFLSYVRKEHFDGTIFHRVISTFMIQGGGFTVDMDVKPTDKAIKLESDNGLKNDRGTVAMARTSNPDSATCQFFINVVDNGMLNKEEAQDGNGYAVFGKVVAGMAAVDAIRDVKCYDAIQVGRQQHQNVPIDPVVIETARQITAEEAKKKTDAEKAAATGGGDGD